MVVSTAGQWVLLAYRIPRRPSTLRITIWRKLDPLGVARLRDGLVALPADARTREQLEWIGEEIGEVGGSSNLWPATAASLAQERAIAAEMRQARAAEYRAVAEQAEAAATARPGGRRPGGQAAAGRTAQDRPPRLLPAPRTRDGTAGGARSGRGGRAGRGRMKWATRAGVHIDRAACAWLIRRHIDADAEFVFRRRSRRGPGRRPAPRPGEPPFSREDPRRRAGRLVAAGGRGRPVPGHRQRLHHPGSVLLRHRPGHLRRRVRRARLRGPARRGDAPSPGLGGRSPSSSPN